MNNTKKDKKKHYCWVCGSEKFSLFKKSNIEKDLNAKMFSISDSHYGVTSDIYRCGDCGFLQSHSIDSALSFYEELIDSSYEESRKARSIQARGLLNIIKKYKPKGTLLDVGAGSGILVKQAFDFGYKASGVEPSKWLVQKANEYNLPVHLGTLPHQNINEQYDIVTFIDVIEHVVDPINILNGLEKVMKKDGILVVVTPDVGSFFAKIMSKKWWHFRIAHLSYFNHKTFKIIFERIGLEPVKLYRPSWYFPLDYLVERLNTYLPKALKVPSKPFLRKITIPLNLGDSMLGIFKRRDLNGY